MVPSIINVLSPRSVALFGHYDTPSVCFCRKCGPIVRCLLTFHMNPPGLRESLTPASPPFFQPWNRPLMPALVWSLGLCVSVCVPARVCFLIAVGWYRAALTTAHSPASCGADSCVSIGGATHLFQMAPITHTHTHTELWETWTRFPFSPPH